MAPPVIGLTGPMCAGKNRAQDFLERQGFTVLDTDETAHEALDLVKDAVLSEFSAEAAERGMALARPDGSIDRRTLGALVFSDPELLSRHERIIYPKIDELIHRFIDEHRNTTVVINAPMLHKSSVLDRCSFVLFVSAPLILRLFRAIRRDTLPIRQILQRFFAQKHLYTQYIAKNADIVRVDNRGSIRAFEKKLAMDSSCGERFCAHNFWNRDFIVFTVTWC